MKGIRVINKAQTGIAPGSAGWKRDYQFVDIIESIADLIGGLYWLLDSVVPRHTAADGATFDEYDTRYHDLVLWETGHLRLGARDFVPLFAKYIDGDWDQIAGVRELPRVNDINFINRELVTSKAVIFFRCIDALYWEAYSPDLALLESLREAFAATESCDLEMPY